MNVSSIYSIVIHPNNDIIQLFKNLKSQLKIKSGKYSSCDALAHITITEFEATDEQLRKIILKLIKIASEEKCFDAFFDQIICSEKSSSVFALPNKNSSEYFHKLLKRIRKDLNLIGRSKNAAHISIGRSLYNFFYARSRQIGFTIKYLLQNVVSIHTLNFKVSNHYTSSSILGNFNTIIIFLFIKTINKSVTIL